MLGNVLEWCWDWYADNVAPPSGLAVDPSGAEKGSDRVVRGGSWDVSAQFCRAARRCRIVPGDRDSFLGFRVAAVQSVELQAREREGRPRALKLVWIDPGEFLMGSPASEEERLENELKHPVRITERFGIGKYPVTQAEYEAVMGKNPSHFSKVGPDAPVESVSWDDAMEFCRRLTQQHRESDELPRGYEYTLPTEAQWEYACRAGSTTAFHFGDSLSSKQANFDGNYPYRAEKGPYLGRTTPVGTYEANAWGLYDLHGNVWEWCRDWYGPYPPGEVTDPLGPDTGSYRVVRGGSWSEPEGRRRARDGKR